MWTIKKIRRTVRRVIRRRVSVKGTRAHYVEHKERARLLVTERLAHFNQHYGFTYNRISIRNQSSRWGSCSRNGNLNFTYRLVLIPLHLADYIIVHELCHLKEFNHKAAFWNLVAEQIPDYASCRDQLKKIALTVHVSPRAHATTLISSQNIPTKNSVYTNDRQPAYND